MGAKNEIKIAYIDFGGVMVEIKKPLLAVAKKLSVNDQEFIEIWRPFDNAACRGDISADEMWKNIFEKLNLTYLGEDPTKMWVDGFEKNLKVHRMIKEISRYCAVGILSNMYDGFYPEMVKRGLIPKVDYAAVILSSEVRSIKPEPRIFEIAERRAGVDPKQILLLDDLEPNIKVASVRGWTGILYDSANSQIGIDQVLDLVQN